MNPLIELYSKILKGVGCELDSNNFVMYKNEFVIINTKGKQKKLVLPTEKNLKDCNWDECVAFHPACESTPTGQSEVLNTLVALGAATIHTRVLVLIAAMVEMYSDKKALNTYNLAQKELLSNFEVDDKVLDIVQEIVKRNTGISGKFPLLSFKLDRGGKIDGVTYSRTCKLISHVLNNTEGFCGYTQGSIASKEEVRNLFRCVLPEKFSRGSDSSNTPYLFSFLECYYAISTHLNSIKNTIGKKIKINDINLEWFEDLHTLHNLYRKHLPQPLNGNQGLLLKKGHTDTGQNNNVVENTATNNNLMKKIEKNEVKRIPVNSGNSYNPAGLAPLVKPSGSVYNSGQPIAEYQQAYNPPPAQQFYQQPIQQYQPYPQQMMQPPAVMQQPLSPEAMINMVNRNAAPMVNNNSFNPNQNPQYMPQQYGAHQPQNLYAPGGRVYR